MDLKTKVGPLPLWGWLAIGEVGWWLSRHYQANTAATTAAKEQTVLANAYGNITGDPFAAYAGGSGAVAPGQGSSGTSPGSGAGTPGTSSTGTTTSSPLSTTTTTNAGGSSAPLSPYQPATTTPPTVAQEQQLAIGVLGSGSAGGWKTAA